MTSTVPTVSTILLPTRTESTLQLIKKTLDKLTLRTTGDPLSDSPGFGPYSLIDSPQIAASIGGKIQSGSIVYGDGVLMYLRNLYSVAADGFWHGWKQGREWPYEAINELIFFESFLDLRRPPVRRQLEGARLPPIDIKHISDSSDSAYAALFSRYLDYDSAHKIIRGPASARSRSAEDLLLVALSLPDDMLGTDVEALRPLLSAESFTGLDADASSTLRELIPILASCIILCNKGLLTGRAIAFYSDNAAVPRIMRRGSSVKNIQRLAQAANNLLLRFNVVPAFHWLSRDEQVMVIADTGSRVTDNHDYFLETSEFERLFSPGKGNLGWHTRRPAVDLFANRRNTKCPKSFFSQTYSEHCIGLDATTTGLASREDTVCVPAH